MTKIEWTEKTWNPIVGCSVLTPGCTNCYAMKMAWRLANNPATPHYAGTVEKVKGKPVWTGKVALAPDRVLTEPLRRRKPTTYFVNSMGDLFHEDVPDAWIDRVFAVGALCPHHILQILTKRGERMREYLTSRHTPIRICTRLQRLDPHDAPSWPLFESQWPLANVWLGVSAERQAEADERIPDLLDTPAAVRFLSAEPLLGPVDFDGMWEPHPNPGMHINMLESLDWVIAGGESGPGARPMHPDWARALRDQCQAAQVPFFFKQWGEWLPGENYMLQRPAEPAQWQDGETGQHSSCRDRPEDRTPEWRHFGRPGDPGAFALRIGKSRAGRTLDGRTWDEMPEVRNG